MTDANQKRPNQRTARSRRLRWLLAVASLWLLAWLGKDLLFLAVLRQQSKKVPDVLISLDDAHLSFFPGSVELSGVQVQRPGEPQRAGVAGGPLTLLHVGKAKTSWQWRHLLRGAITASAQVKDVDVTIWRVPKRGNNQRGKSNNNESEVVPAPPEADTIVAAWPQISRFVVPISIDTADVSNARVILRDVSVTPPLRFPIEGIEVHAENLTNRKALNDGRYASVKVSAKPAKGQLQVAMQVDPMARLPTFAMHASLKELDVPSVNDVLLGYANFDAKSGTLRAEVDVACEQGKFRGTLEPRLQKFEVNPRAQDEDKQTFVNRAYRFLINAASSLVKDRKEETIATRVPLQGEFTDPSIGVGQAVLSLLGNAWWEALKPSNALPEGALPELRGSLGKQGQSPKPAKPEKTRAKKVKKAGIK